MVYHSVVINVSDNSNNCFIDIYQNDGNSHEIIFKLIDGDRFFNVSGYTPEITFYDEEAKAVVITSAVTVLNDYRGYLSYVIGNSLLRKYGRYVVTLSLKMSASNEDCVCRSDLSFKLVLNVLKSDGPHCGCNYEVAITKKFYDKLRSHLDNTKIHLSDSDREALDWLLNNFSYLETLGDDVETLQSYIPEGTSSPDNTLVNETMLSNAISASGAMHFLGMAPHFEGNTDLEDIDAYLTFIEHTPKTGDVIICQGSSKQYLYSDGVWQEVHADAPVWNTFTPEEPQPTTDNSLNASIADKNLTIQRSGQDSPVNASLDKENLTLKGVNADLADENLALS